MKIKDEVSFIEKLIAVKDYLLGKINVGYPWYFTNKKHHRIISINIIVKSIIIYKKLRLKI